MRTIRSHGVLGKEVLERESVATQTSMLVPDIHPPQKDMSVDCQDVEKGSHNRADKIGICREIAGIILTGSICWGFGSVDELTLGANFRFLVDGSMEKTERDEEQSSQTM